MDFVAATFHTATHRQSSACSVSLVRVCDSAVESDIFEALIQPPGNIYSRSRVELHHINPAATSDKPAFGEVWQQAASFVGDDLLIAADRPTGGAVLRFSAEAAGCPLPDCDIAYSQDLWLGYQIVLANHRLDEAAAVGEPPPATPSLENVPLESAARDLGLDLHTSKAEQVARVVLAVAEAHQHSGDVRSLCESLEVPIEKPADALSNEIIAAYEKSHPVSELAHS